jgi:hypothetical protein
MVDGTIVYRGGELQFVDRAEIEAAVGATAEASREPADPALAELMPELQAQLRRHYGRLTGGAD